MPDSSTAASPPTDGDDDGHTRRDVLAGATAAGSVLVAGCAALQSNGRNEPEGGPGFADGEERVLDPDGITVDGEKGLMSKRDVHVTNNHGSTHTLSVSIARGDEELFADEYTLDEKDEVELKGIFATHGEFAVTVGMDGEARETLDVVIDAEHLGVRGIVFEDGTLSVRQVPCDANSCP